jgi:hypothetical protein
LVLTKTLGFVVSCGYPSELFDLCEVIFHQMPPLVDLDVIIALDFAVGFGCRRRRNGESSTARTACPKLSKGLRSAMASAKFKPPPDQASPTFAHISLIHSLLLSDSLKEAIITLKCAKEVLRYHRRLICDGSPPEYST